MYLNETIDIIKKEQLRASNKRCHRRYFQHAQFIPIVGVGKRGEY